MNMRGFGYLAGYLRGAVQKEAAAATQFGKGQPMEGGAARPNTKFTYPTSENFGKLDPGVDEETGRPRGGFVEDNIRADLARSFAPGRVSDSTLANYVRRFVRRHRDSSAATGPRNR